MTGSRTAFFYGTLMSAEVLYRVIYGTVSPDPWQKERLNIQPAFLNGYQRHRVKDADYPAIYPLENVTRSDNPESQRVLGVLVSGLGDMDIMRLDIFEGDQYDRKHVEAFPTGHGIKNEKSLSEQGIQAETYVWKSEYLAELDPEEWDFEEFRREKLQYWAGPEVMREDYDLVDAAVAEQEKHDGTHGRGANGAITKQLSEMQRENGQEEPLKSAV